MVDLKRAMAKLHEAKIGRTLIYISAARFDQQTTTKPHLDGGPEQSLVMLGYEPSEVQSELAIADYARCAFDMGMTPQAYLARHNPMFAAGSELLRPYTTRIPCFSRTNFQIALINNSSADYAPDAAAWQGTLHTPTIIDPDERQRRVINSTMIASAPPGTTDAVSAAELAEFMQTTAVRRQGYDKGHLQDRPASSSRHLRNEFESSTGTEAAPLITWRSHHICPPAIGRQLIDSVCGISLPRTREEEPVLASV